MAAFLTFIILISGCSAAPAGSGAESRTVAPANSTHYEPPAFRNAEFHPDAAVSGSGAEIDLSAVSQGYVAVRAQSDKRLKCQVVYGDVKYNYDLPGDGTPVVYPLQSGNGQYNVRVMQNTTENKYMDVPFPVSWTVKMKKKQKETQDILSYHTQAAGCSDKARAKASGGRQPIEECGRTGL